MVSSNLVGVGQPLPAHPDSLFSSAAKRRGNICLSKLAPDASALVAPIEQECSPTVVQQLHVRDLEPVVTVEHSAIVVNCPTGSNHLIPHTLELRSVCSEVSQGTADCCEQADVAMLIYMDSSGVWFHCPNFATGMVVELDMDNLI